MIDIHNHVLPGVDDGSESLEMSLRMLREAWEDGITQAIVTPHYVHGGEFRIQAKEIMQRFLQLRQAAGEDGNPIELFIGNELFISPHLDELLRDGKVLSLAGTAYVLVEFPFREYRTEYDEYLYNIRIMGGKVIIAHPERYAYVQENHGFAERWLNEGYLLQSNGSSLRRKGTKSVVYDLIERGQLSFMASDGHNDERPVVLKDAYSQISRDFSKSAADVLFDHNPRCITEGGTLADLPETKRRRRFF